MNDFAPPSRVGMIGIGLMGHGIARNLLAHGHHLTVLDHPGNQPLDELLAAGASCCATPAEVAQQADVVLLCVTGSPQVEAVLLGEHGVVRGLKRGAVVIDCSTAKPERTRVMAQAVADHGAHFIDAAMTRTPKEAAEGRLNLLVGGAPDVVARCQPLLQCFAEHITATGPVGSGHAMKLLHNYVSLGAIALIAEAAACAQHAGVDASVLVDVLRQGGGGGVALERIAPFLTTGDASNLRFAMGNAAKDMAYYQAMAQGLQAPFAIAQGVAHTYNAAVQIGGAERHVPELAAVLSQLKPR